MAIPVQNVSGKEPDLNQCATEHVVEDFSRCLSNNTACRYAVPAGTSSSYCIHPNHRSLQGMLVPGGPGDRRAYGWHVPR
ncbi:hypothetical protein [Geobacter sp. AOG2]|uniref:hypothetical protein n=1 Tax=Geobacter sp. AOG2 TaxID=1566347 RepID=UPI001CC70A84|nr:hypothetical protein [Geobacter sp. AOG2]GFE61976.1 hypothetical protein AOG2_25640 [Geobacter sp. AOG2]